MKLTTQCPIEGCGKTLELVSSMDLSQSESLNTFKCGHSFIQPITAIANSLVDSQTGQISYRLQSCKGDKLAFDYQKDAIDFIFDPTAYLKKNNIPYIGTNGPLNCLIADQMGLGKTIEGLLSLAAAYEKATPCLILVKSATIWQWIKEYKEWADPTPCGIFLIEGSKSWIPPGFKSYICPMDTFSRIVQTDEGQQKLLDFGFKLLIVDEIHSFKNASSKRTQALISFIKKISHREITRQGNFICNMCGKSWSEEITIQVDLSSSAQNAQHYHSTHCPGCGASLRQVIQKSIADERENERMGLIFLSGTPIKNRAEEYFVPLNILAPERFPSLERFRRNYLVQDGSKWKSIQPYMLETFRKTIAPYVLRRERKDVLKDLPAFTRNFTLVSIDDEVMKTAYNAEIDKLLAKDESLGRDLKASDIQDNIMTMRRIIGMAKVKHAADYIEEFLEDNEDDKIAIGIHHHAVRDALIYELGKRNVKGVVKINAGSDIQYYVDQWKLRPESRVGVLSQLGGGVGLNLQFCHNLLNCERQWNSADEEQLEDRFNRVGQEYPVSADYLVARGTIDVWFSNMVEEKRIIAGETFGVNFDPMGSKELMNDMIQWAMVNKL